MFGDETSDFISFSNSAGFSASKRHRYRLDRALLRSGAICRVGRNQQFGTALDHFRHRSVGIVVVVGPDDIQHDVAVFDQADLPQT